MSASATIPFTPSQPKPQPWSPDSRDRLIFQWVKFDGHQQSWVAEQLGIDQSTVSRAVQRYERWIARGGPSQQGAPSQDERLRAERWLAYERNEWILASALRLAGDMERALDTTESTVLHPRHDPSQQSKVRTEYKVIDRSGIAARFLRLAYRINMDQLKLVEQEPLPALEPLTTADLADDLPLEAGRGEDFETDFSEGTSVGGWHGPSARDDRVNQESPSVAPSNAAFGLVATLEPVPPPPVPSDSGCCGPSARANRAAESGPAGIHPDSYSQSADRQQQNSPSPAPLMTESELASDSHPLTLDASAVISIDLIPDSPPLHKTHKLIRAKSILNTNPRTASADSRSANKPLPAAYAVASSSPENGGVPQPSR